MTTVIYPVQKSLIVYLSKHDSATSSSLAQILGVSVRSVKTYIKELNMENPGLIQSGKKGYSINREMS